MRKQIICTLLILIIVIFGTKDVYAVTGITAWDGKPEPTGIIWYETGLESGASKKYDDTRKALIINGQKYVAYCLDPGLSLHKDLTYTCAPLSDPGALSIINGGGGNYAVTQMALRFYAVFKGYGSSQGLKAAKAAMIRFAQIKDGVDMIRGCAEGGIACSGNEYDYLRGNNAVVDQAYEMARAARDQTTSYQTASGGLTFTKTAASTPEEITYRVTSLQSIDKVKFVCDGCTIVGSDKNFSGRSGTVVVRPPANCSTFKIKAYYVPKGIQICHYANSAKSETYQYLIVNFDENSEESPATEELDTSGEANDMFADRSINCMASCCTEKELEPYHVEGDINNCCLDNTHSEAKEYDLNDLVCYSSEFQVSHYWQMCNSENYLDKKMNGELNEYCSVFCTERITVDVPGAITATSGRYFDLTTTSQGTKSPYIEGFKRCRMLINFKKWQDDYRKQVEEQVKQYNLYQKYRLWDLIYEDALGKTKSCLLEMDIHCDDDYKHTITVDHHTGLITCEEHIYVQPSEKDKIILAPYTTYYFTNPAHNHKQWHSVKLKEEGLKPSAEGYYNYYKIEPDSSTQIDYRDESLWDTQEKIQEAQDYMTAEQSKKKTGCNGEKVQVKCSITYKDNCGHGSPEIHGALREDVVSKHNDWHGQAEAAKGAYSAAVVNAKNLEEKLDKCDKYFTDFEGADAESNFQFNASFFGFEYTQIYLTDFGDLKKDVTVIPFSPTPGCETSGPILGPDDEDGMVEPQYSNKYYSDKITEAEDFGETDIDWQEPRNGFEGYIHELYEADQRFVQDAKYKATCSWDEPENTKYTLVQKGVVQESDFNMTKNDRQYQVYLATLEGEYDTRWLLSGLGTNSKFDAYFAENGEVCSSRQSAMTDGLFHCVLRVDYEIISTGKCNGERSTTETDECEKYNGNETVLNFKVVDPAVVFTCNSTSECGYGYNWFDMPGGQATLSDMRMKGSNVTTYAPENKTYQITLTSKDMREIKNYNRWRENNNYGGYSDFSLSCDCPDAAEECNEVGGTQTCKRSESCGMCRSQFLDDLYNGYISYGGSHSLTGAAGNLENIRSSGHVHWTG